MQHEIRIVLWETDKNEVSLRLKQEQISANELRKNFISKGKQVFYSALSMNSFDFVQFLRKQDFLC